MNGRESNNSANCVVLRITDELRIDELVKINVEAFTHPWTKEMFLDELRCPNRSYLYAAFTRSRRIAGYCSVWAIEDTLQVNSLAVAVQYQRQGIAGSLLKEIVTLGGKLRSLTISLEVRKSNRVARSLYGRYRFKEIGARAGYYRQPTEDAVILSRCLESRRGV